MGRINTYNVMHDHNVGMSVSDLAVKYNCTESHIRTILHNRMDIDAIEEEFKREGCINCTPNVSFACKWGRPIQCGYSTNLCNYILRTGNSRGCPATACTKFEREDADDFKHSKNDDLWRMKWTY